MRSRAAVSMLLIWFAGLAILLQPFQSWAEADVDRSYDRSASALAKQGNWKQHSRVVSQWLKRSPDSARAWYHEGLLLRALNRPGPIVAFERAVRLDPTLAIAWQALCVEHYNEGNLLESLICAEHIPLNAMREEFVAQTFQHPIHVGGMINRRRPGNVVERLAMDAPIQGAVRTKSSELTDLQAQSAAIAQDQMARRDAQERARINSLYEQCEALKEATEGVIGKGPFGAVVGGSMGIQAYKVCVQYDQAVQERLIYEALRSQQR